MEDVRDKVTTFIISQLKKFYPDVPVIRAKQNYAVKFEKYIVVDLLNEINLGDEERYDEGKEEYSVVGLREAIFNVKAIGKGSIELLGSLQLHLEKPTVVDDFYVANISVPTVDSLIDLTDLIDSRAYKEIASVDVTVSYDRYVIDNPGWFDTVYINGVLGYQDKEKTNTSKHINIIVNDVDIKGTIE